MRKSVVFLSFVAALVMWSCGAKSNQSENESQDSIAAKQECQKQCDEKNAFIEKWAKFDSLAVEEQEALLAKRAECFGKMKAAFDEKKGECKEAKKECADKSAEEKAACEAKKAEFKKIMEQVDAEWVKYEKMTVAEKKAFFDKFDQLMPKDSKACGNKADKKECGKEKACCKDGGSKKECDQKGGAKKDCCKNK